MYKKTILTNSALVALLASSNFGSTSVFAAETQPSSSTQETNKEQNQSRMFILMNQYASAVIEQADTTQTKFEQMKKWDSILLKLKGEFENFSEKSYIFVDLKGEWNESILTRHLSNIFTRWDSVLLELKNKLAETKNYDSDIAALKNKMIHHQQTTKTNANEWLMNYNQEFPQIIQGISNDVRKSDLQFIDSYNLLTKAVSDNDTETYKNALTKLISIVDKNRQTIDTRKKNIFSFHQKLMADINNLTEDQKQIQSIVLKKNDMIDTIQKSLHVCDETIKKLEPPYPYRKDDCSIVVKKRLESQQVLSHFKPTLENELINIQSNITALTNRKVQIENLKKAIKKEYSQLEQITNLLSDLRNRHEKLSLYLNKELANGVGSKEISLEIDRQWRDSQIITSIMASK